MNEFRYVTFLRTLVAFALLCVSLFARAATLEFNIRHTTSWGKLNSEVLENGGESQPFRLRSLPLVVEFIRDG